MTARRLRREVLALEAAGDPAEALARARASAALEAGNPRIQLVAAKTAARCGNPVLAAAWFRAAWEAASPFRRWKIAGGVARGLTSIGLGEEALGLLETLDRTMAAGPLGLERARVLQALSRDEEAIRTLESTVAASPSYEPAWSVLIDLLDTCGRSELAEEARRGKALVPAKLALTNVVEAVVAAVPEATRYVVNIGCRDGKTKDPCYQLFRRGYAGLAIDAGNYPRLYKRLPSPEVGKLLGTVVTPANVVSVLRRAECPTRPVAVKIDIDSYDGPLLEALLHGFEPDVIHVEVNPDFPPPLEFAITYDARHAHGAGAGFYGCSLSYALAVCRPAGYELLQIDFGEATRAQDAILVKQERLELFGLAEPVDERALFLREPYGGWRGLVEVGVDTRSWRDDTDYERLRTTAWDACAAASIHRSGTVLPFALRVGKAEQDGGYSP